MLHQLGVQPLGGVALGGLGRVDQVGDVEIAVTDMTDDVLRQAGRVGLAHRLADALGQQGDRHAGIGGHGAAAGVGRHAGGSQCGARVKGEPGSGLASCHFTLCSEGNT